MAGTNAVVHFFAAILIVVLAIYIALLQRRLSVLNRSMGYSRRIYVGRPSHLVRLWAKSAGIPFEDLSFKQNDPEALRRIDLSQLLRLHLSNEILMIRLVSRDSNDKSNRPISIVGIELQLAEPLTNVDVSTISNEVGCAVAVTQ